MINLRYIYLAIGYRNDVERRESGSYRSLFDEEQSPGL